MKNLLKKGLIVVTAAAASASVALAQAVDYGTKLNDNFTIIDTLWGKVATVMIAVALVGVGLRFFKKTK